MSAMVHLGTEEIRPDAFFSNEELGRLRELASAPKRWWRNYPLVVSVLAFLLSLATSTLSIYTNHQKDIHDQQAELAGALKALQDLAVQQIELQSKYGNRPDGAAAIELIKNETYNTTLQASDLALKLGSDATTAVLLPISQRLFFHGQGSKAEATGKLALSVAASIEDEVVALKWLAAMAFQSGRSNGAAEGSDLYRTALNADKKYDLVASANVIVGWLKAGTLFEWAHYLAPADCNQAKLHFAEGVNLLNTLPPNPDTDTMRAKIAQEITVGVGGVPSCKTPDGVALAPMSPQVAAPN